MKVVSLCQTATTLFLIVVSDHGSIDGHRQKAEKFGDVSGQTANYLLMSILPSPSACHNGPRSLLLEYGLILDNRDWRIHITNDGLGRWLDATHRFPPGNYTEAEKFTLAIEPSIALQEGIDQAIISTKLPSDLFSWIRMKASSFKQETESEADLETLYTKMEAFTRERILPLASRQPPLPPRSELRGDPVLAVLHKVVGQLVNNN